ncbi:S9 family peptidase [Polaribacter reichenbachii]|uniref:Peptidase S9 n=1 Tax=Polaribacter reichenbachii TaxID=996801 RepID=A0A1B8TRX1_9FLAO|nr:S9 family peptidase [Polaribacter reichenbachii]APZ44909.1 S9 family peptidase [Polaribacter reichenbachii]AUC18773.1 S9 family peptidase [Polaribacter reichenbachii]OBY62397.1 peptidase S9 [Polaribacter reichenbachii]
MKKSLILVTIFTLITSINYSQQDSKNTSGTKEITLEEIWDGTFSAKRMNSLNSMNGDFYSLLNRDKDRNTSVDKYSYATLEKVETIVNSKDLPEIDGFQSYSFNNDETKIILGTNFKKIYRHSYTGTYYAYDVATKKVTLIGEDIQEPIFSPDNKKVAYAKNNDLFIKDFSENKIIQVTKDGKKNSIINGITDWVYEEEFAFVRAFEWSNNSEYLAFLRFDESKVPTFSMDIVGKELYPSQQVFKYPKAGEKNADVTLHMYTIASENSKKIALGDYEYIPRIKWSNDDKILIATTLNRHQNDLKLHKVDAVKNTTSVLLNETDKAYIDITDNLTFLVDNSFIWTSEKDGYNHIYHYDFDGKLINQITKGNWEVTRYYGFNESKKTIYYQSVENGSINRGVYSIKLNGKNKKLLSNEDGQNSAAFSTNLNYFINTFSSAEIPPIYSLYNAKGKMLKVIKDNGELKEELAAYKMSPKEFSTININGNDLNMWMIKPVDFDESKTYPMFMFQYSGPGSQQVGNKWNAANDYWHNMLAQKGMIVVCIDGRGTGLKGAEFKKITQKELGKFEVEDQIAAAKKLAERSYIDKNNIGIWGWSYGGFMSTNVLLKGNDIFTTAIAVAPVTSWRFYDTVYTERYMQTPQENASGYDDNSPINYADKLEGNYLLVHGTGDDNVHVQNSMRMINSLIEANKQFDMFIVPDRTHGIYKGRNTRLNLYTKMTNFVVEHLLN